MREYFVGVVNYNKNFCVGVDGAFFFVLQYVSRLKIAYLLV